VISHANRKSHAAEWSEIYMCFLLLSASHVIVSNNICLTENCISLNAALKQQNFSKINKLLFQYDAGVSLD